MDGSSEANELIAAKRSAIDDIDCKLVELLNERARLALEIRGLKPEIRMSLYDPQREEEIFDHLASSNKGPLYGENLREIFEAILHVMKEIPS